MGRDVLAAGGNAVDAAVATAFALAVTWPEAGNIGGGGFMLIYPGDGQLPVCVDYRETAPASATVDMFSWGESRHTLKMVGVPGTVRGLELAHQRFGRLPWKRLVQPAVELAGHGFEVDANLADSINRVLADDEVRAGDQFAELRRVYGNPGGGPWRAGDRLVLPDLAETLSTIAEVGPGAFYQGPIADRLVDGMRREGGWICREDLASYRARLREPIHGSFCGFDVYGPPPPSSGGITLVEMLNMAESLQLDRQDRYSPRTLHLMAEIMRRAFRDRAAYLGDPDFVTPPENLTDKRYARRLAAGIDPARATPSDNLAGEIRLSKEGDDTTHFSVAGADGMAVSNTYTLEASWGSRKILPGTGFVLNNEMGDFNWVAEYTNRSGRIGTPANLIAPGKRMLSSQCPAIAARNGRAVLVTGSPGGRTIINTVFCILVNRLGYGFDLPTAIALPRMHHQWFPDRLDLEMWTDPRYGDAVAELKALGHRVANRSMQGSAHSIAIARETGEMLGVADWRRGGFAAGVEGPPGQ